LSPRKAKQSASMNRPAPVFKQLGHLIARVQEPRPPFDTPTGAPVNRSANQ